MVKRGRSGKSRSCRAEQAPSTRIATRQSEERQPTSSIMILFLSMTTKESFSRRGFLALAAGSSYAAYAQHSKHIPVGLLIYDVIADWKKDFDGTLKAVAQMGYEGVELTQYESWTPARAKEVRKLLDSIKLQVLATHTEPGFFMPGDKMKAAIELNQILGTRT